MTPEQMAENLRVAGELEGRAAKLRADTMETWEKQRSEMGEAGYRKQWRPDEAARLMSRGEELKRQVEELERAGVLGVEDLPGEAASRKSVIREAMEAAEARPTRGGGHTHNLEAPPAGVGVAIGELGKALELCQKVYSILEGRLSEITRPWPEDPAPGPVLPTTGESRLVVLIGQKTLELHRFAERMATLIEHLEV